jgi:alpha-galactosidase
VSARTLTVSNGEAQATLHPAKGIFDISADKDLAVTGATAGITFADGEETTLTLADGRLVRSKSNAERLSAVYRLKGVELEVSISVAPRPKSFVIELAFKNVSRKPRPVKALLPVCSTRDARVRLGFSPRGVRVYRNGWYSWDYSRVVGLLEPHGECAEDDSFLGPAATVEVKGLVRSSLVTQLRGKNGFLTAGFLSEARQFTVLSTAAAGGRIVFSAAALADGKPIAPGRTYRAEPLFVGFAEDPNAALADYGSLLGEEMKARRPSEVPSGWCSWYYYYGGVNEEECLANLTWMAENRHRFDLRVFQIDAGWQTGDGYWSENREKFPRGMKALADDIRAAGLVPGLWFAPFNVPPDSKLAADHPDWLVRNADGLPRAMPHLGGELVYGLDLTNPRVLGFVAEVTSRVCRDWGYDYIKIDFLNFGATKGVRLDNTKTRAQNLRRGLEVIRQVAGPDRFILGCGCPLGPAIGVVDGMRVSQDVAPNWGGMLSVLASSWALTRNWTHNLLWANDPDCLLLRDAQTDLSPVEVETLANMVILSGGSLMLSDRLGDLPRERLEMLGRMFPAPTTAAVPLDLYKRARPAVYFAAGEPVLIGVFNWEDRPQTLKINPRRILGGIPVSKMRDLWRGGEESIPTGIIALTLEPHASRLLVFE